MKDPLKIVAAVGLAPGGVLGIAGTMVSNQNVRATCWGIDAVGIVVAASLLALRFFRRGDDCVAAGFLVLAIGEGVMLSGTAATLVDSVPSFAAGTALWSAALLLTSIPAKFALWTRLTGIVGAVLFAVTAARIFMGEQNITDYFSAAVLRLSIPGSHLHRLDLGFAERRMSRLTRVCAVLDTHGFSSTPSNQLHCIRMKESCVYEWNDSLRLCV